MSEPEPQPESARHVYHRGFPLDDKTRPSLFHRLMRTTGFRIFWALFIIAFSTVPVTFLTIYVFSIGILGIVGHRKLRTFSDWSIRSWLNSMAFITRYILGIKVKIYGDSRRFDKHCLFILNHRCHFDWMFFWDVAGKLGNLSWWMVMLKNSLKRVPIAGWAMQYRNYAFLSRDWESDYKEFAWKFHYLNATGEPYQFLMFPEGRDLTPIHQKKSDQFAAEKSLPRYEYTLHPKTKGFVYVIKALKKGRLESVYDMTVGYPDVLSATEIEFLSEGRIPSEVHYHVKKYNISELPESEEELEAWLRQRWAEKEERLRLFYKHRKFVQLPCDDKEIQNGTSRNAHETSNGNSSHVIPSPEVKLYFPWCQLLEGLIFLLFLSGGSLLLCYYSWIGIIALLASFVLNGYFCTYHGKMDYLIMDHFRKTCAEFLPEDYKKED
ncbi:PREDICTED: lysocardiolipin acyltransferase 1-like [Amphimedon queenslandica]|uniref:Phospholipid/glycerol acyltransferase domain-containing protein n=1 Tax=Amphimedon queenslandica TaxID=400682 RepID=A0A1X7UWR4_AMPQE|nr:PREDICTED: lysocardiolipin acyltransferase 1-like [Amphimedon queenslandica]|eukprot:XP_011403843.2 PREDICTED: lysocardiolipin acyltransferase 1-like [Amphimedon queenslandica]